MVFTRGGHHIRDALVLAMATPNSRGPSFCSVAWTRAQGEFERRPSGSRRDQRRGNGCLRVLLIHGAIANQLGAGELGLVARRLMRADSMLRPSRSRTNTARTAWAIPAGNHQFSR